METSLEYLIGVTMRYAFMYFPKTSEGWVGLFTHHTGVSAVIDEMENSAPCSTLSEASLAEIVEIAKKYEGQEKIYNVSAPTRDWVNEADKLDRLVQEAEKQIKDLLSPGGGAIQISAEIFQLVWRKGDAVYVTHSYTTSRGKRSLNDVPARTIFLILASLQKAVSGR